MTLRLLAGSAAFAVLSAGQAAACAQMTYDGASFTACAIDLPTQDVRLFLRDPEGTVWGGFDRLDEGLQPGGQRLGMAMNAGMFHADRAPVGLYVEDGAQEMRVVTSEGPGNFGLLPNGVLCLGEGSAAIIESRLYAADPPACRSATQSGPLLVIDDALHPRFLRDSDSLNIRNGAGVSEDGTTLWLAISDAPVNFHHFARFFRDGLGTPDALYFDGRVSRLHAPDLGRSDPGVPMGPIIGTVVDADGTDG